MGVLYVVGTPLGNLEDLSPRAARILGTVRLVAAEDTRRTGQLLRHLGVRVPLTSYHAHNWRSKESEILDALSQGDVALVTDGGMPGISDPGAEIVAAAARAGFPVSVVPGPSAVIAALAVSGFSADRFLFLGFLERKGPERRVALDRIAHTPETVVLYEAPHRLRQTLADLAERIPDRSLVVCRELTKLHEEVFRGTAAAALAHFSEPRGEITLVIGPAKPDRERKPEADDRSTDTEAGIDERIRALRAAGLSARDIASQLAAETGQSRRAVYQRVLEVESE